MATRSEPSARPWSPQLRGMLVMLGYACVWAVVGGIGFFGSGAALLPTVVVAVAVTALVAGAMVVAARSGGPRPERRRRGDSGRVFGGVNAAQAVLIVAAVAVLVPLGLGPFLPAAICLVVGLHFLPLAWTFGQPQFWVTGTLLVALAAVVLVLTAAGDAGTAVSVGLVGAVSAVVLWATALAVGVRG